MTSKTPTIAVIGLGYVGLPLAVEFGKHYPTIGYDLKASSIISYEQHADPTGELSEAELKAAKHIEYTTDPQKITAADFIIVAVPTPIDNARQPDLSPLKSASETAGRYMKEGAVVVYESTVYPGATEEVCVPILEKFSGRTWKQGFYVGYSPERINPGDKEHTLTRIVKVVSGDTDDTLDQIARLYGSIITAGVYRASNIKTAEAAKVIENTQRDLNIALMNELAVIFDKLNIDTIEVLEAAATKWNFLPFRPGLVGGHCIGVDPYYLTYKAETCGYHPEVILAGRRINDNMGRFVVAQAVKLMTRAGLKIHQARVGILGLTFKEDCSDLRNSRVIDIIEELQEFCIDPIVHDPLADEADAQNFFSVRLSPWEAMTDLDAMIIAVGHRVYKQLDLDEFISRLNPNGCIIDIKSILDVSSVKKSGVNYWRL
ncbi:MAG: nucleotide sugar dehydrogenase [Desulfobacteraceae bacterium]|nr:MAG: nucleotide sugar dehydrogenase [Desulfobacteraceae bacterium]